jgi:hypothetical protein
MKRVNKKLKWKCKRKQINQNLRKEKKAAYLHSSQGMASRVHTGSSRALIQRSGIDTDCT